MSRHGICPSIKKGHASTMLHLTGSPTRAGRVLSGFFTVVYSETTRVTGMKYVFMESRLSDCIENQSQGPGCCHLSDLNSHSSPHRAPATPVSFSLSSHTPRVLPPGLLNPGWFLLTLQVSLPRHHPLAALPQRTANSPLHPLKGLCSFSSQK